MLRLARRQMRKAVGPDDHLHQAVGALDDLQETENVLMERLREWYGLHFPELAKTVDDREFLELIATHGSRDAMPLDATDSVGGPLGEPERRSVMGLAALLRDPAEPAGRGWAPRPPPGCHGPAPRRGEGPVPTPPGSPPPAEARRPVPPSPRPPGPAVAAGRDRPRVRGKDRDRRAGGRIHEARHRRLPAGVPRRQPRVDPGDEGPRPSGEAAPRPAEGPEAARNPGPLGGLPSVAGTRA